MRLPRSASLAVVLAAAALLLTACDQAEDAPPPGKALATTVAPTAAGSSPAAAMVPAGGPADPTADSAATLPAVAERSPSALLPAPDEANLGAPAEAAADGPRAAPLEQDPRDGAKADPGALDGLLQAAADASSPTRQLALRELWLSAADGSDPDGRAQAVLAQALRDGDPAAQALARSALADLSRLRDGSPLPAPDPAEQRRQVEAALASPEPERRAEAIAQVGNVRDAQSVELLLRATYEADAGNRALAARQLWVAAADGLDGDGRSLDTLRELLGDRDPAVSTIARQALDDLAALRSRQSAPPPAAEPGTMPPGAECSATGLLATGERC